MSFHLPRITEKLSIIGRNGSGKTQAAAWILANGHFDKQPYVIIDYKYDELLNSIPRIKELGLNERIPKPPGLYIVHPLPSQTEEMEAYLERIWDREHVGVYVDEAHMLPSRGNFQALLTQGRSKRIPMLVLSQKPSWVTRFVFSEADHFLVFHLTDREDRKRVTQLTSLDLDERLPQYHGRWYDVKEDAKYTLRPVPDRDTILSRFDDRMPRPGWFGVPVRKQRGA